MTDGGHAPEIILECPVLDAASLFDQLQMLGLPRPLLLREPDEAHLTLLYLGNVEQLAREIARSGSTTRPNDVEQRLRHLVTHVVDLGHQITSVHVERTAVLKKSYLVLVVRPDPQLQALRDEAWGTLLALLAGFGVERPLQFLSHSPTVRLPSSSWLPHITLSKNYQGYAPNLVIDKPIKLGPVRLHR